MLITDRHVESLYSESVLKSLGSAAFTADSCSIEPGEASKSLDTLAEVYQYLARCGLGRDGLILALGGGVVSDLAGFAAATWMRGVRFAICPTTLEADIDASIGDKTAINVPGAKNLVGAFHQPLVVAIDPACLKTLDPRDVRAGLGESVKHALISSEEFLAWHEANAEAIPALDPALTTALIKRNLRIKAGIVEEDPRERTGAREVLNFGHTIGHAIEACGGFALRHGECVALGLLAACRLSQCLGSLREETVARVEKLLARLGLPTRLSDPIETERILDALRKDKKVRGGVGRFVLLEGVGRPVVRDDVPEELVRDAYESLLP
jgi:3-dehydroquinate synthase